MKPFFEKCILKSLIAFLLIVIFGASNANAKEDVRIWKPVKGLKAIQVAIHCLDATQGRTCYWWFRNSGETSVTLTYTMTGDGYTIKPRAVRVEHGTIVSRTEITLRPKYEQPFIEGYSGQYIGANNLFEVSVVSYRVGDVSTKKVEVIPPAVRDDVSKIPVQIPVVDQRSEQAEETKKRPQGFCRDLVEVMLDSCRCLPGRKVLKYADIARMTCYLPEKDDLTRPRGKAKEISPSSEHGDYGPPPPPKKSSPCNPAITSCIH